MRKQVYSDIRNSVQNARIKAVTIYVSNLVWGETGWNSLQNARLNIWGELFNAN